MKFFLGNVAILSHCLVLSADAFIQPTAFTPLLFTASGASNPRQNNGKLCSTTQEIDSINIKKVTKSQILADGDDFIKPTLDTRSYRSILLPNNLQALLVSDPETDVEAGAVHIKAGHFDDPEDRPGLAHFNEHMLFLGTSKYPNENDFETFVGKNGGNTNAYTDMEDTNYYFSVAPLDHDDIDEDEEGDDGDVDDDDDIDEGKVSQALSGGLDRFAQFFISPLFSEGSVERELRAIDSEHLNSFTSESWRNYQLLKYSCDQSHPFAKFGCGNYNTLTNGGNITGDDAVSSGGSSPVPALKKFWNEKYVAENMKVCVVGRASLDELQKEVEAAFADVKSNGEVKVEKEADPEIIFQREHNNHGVAFGSEHLGLIREYVPLAESRSIKFLFATPPNDDPTVVEFRPDRVLTHLLGHESPGSLHALLLEEGLINDLSSGVGVTSSDFSLCSISLALTPKGMAQRDLVISLFWQYISLIKTTVFDEDEIMEKYHDELGQISATHFKFRENGDPTGFCSGAAELLHDYKPEKILIGSSMPGPYNATVTKAFLDRLRPDNCIVNIQNSDFEEGEDTEFECSAASAPWQFEKWYRAKYRQVLINDSLKEKWSSSNEIDPRLHLPAMNTFLPTDFSLRSNDPDAIAAAQPDTDYSKENPKLLVDKPGLKMWHKLDRTFKVPKTCLQLMLTTPTPYESPRTMTLMRTYVKVLEDDLNSYIYDASLAGCRARVSCLPSGISVSVNGYSEKLPHLLDVVTGRMLSIINEMKVADESSGLALKFDKATKNLLRETKNFRLESPYETSSYVSRMLLEHNVSIFCNSLILH
jgi:insulysin